MVKYAKIKGTYRAENRAPFISLRKYRNLSVSLQTAPAEQIARLGFGKEIAVIKCKNNSNGNMASILSRLLI